MSDTHIIDPVSQSALERWILCQDAFRVEFLVVLQGFLYISGHHISVFMAMRCTAGEGLTQHRAHLVPLTVATG